MGAISSKTLPKRKKQYTPRSSAYVPVETLIEIEKQEPPRHALCMALMRVRGLRLSDIIGIAKKYHIFHGLRPIDIDAVPLKGSKHSIRLLRKKEVFAVKTLPDDLYDRLQAQIKEYGIKPTERIFPYHRTTVWHWYDKYGLKCVDERYSLSPHCVRRSFGKDYVARGGSITALQKHYSHKRLGQTLEYLGEAEDKANQELLEMENRHE